MFGNYTRFGLPDDDKEWKLTYEKQKRNNNNQSIAIRQCLKCFKVYKGSNAICPYCGNNNGKTKEQIKQEEQAELERIQKVEKYQRKNEIYNCKTYGELVAYAKNKGYKSPRSVGHIIYYKLEKRKGQKNDIFML